jgi:hypothetical protein
MGEGRTEWMARLIDTWNAGDQEELKVRADGSARPR